MRLLLDTHALIWWLAGDEALSRRAQDAIADDPNSVAVSASSAMEVATKYRIGELDEIAGVDTLPACLNLAVLDENVAAFARCARANETTTISSRVAPPRGSVE